MSGDRLAMDRLIAAVRDVDEWLDDSRAIPPGHAPADSMANHWRRVTKACEEAGEVWKAMSRVTGENPRLGECGTWLEVCGELADTAMAALAAIRHVTKDDALVEAFLGQAAAKATARAARWRKEHAE